MSGVNHLVLEDTTRNLTANETRGSSSAQRKATATCRDRLRSSIVAHAGRTAEICNLRDVKTHMEVKAHKNPGVDMILPFLTSRLSQAMILVATCAPYGHEMFVVISQPFSTPLCLRQGQYAQETPSFRFS